MTQLVLTLPDEVARAVAATAEAAAAEVRLMAALKLFEIGRLSSGKAAELAGVPRVTFIEACGRYGVSSFNYADGAVADEVERDLEALRSRGRDLP